MKSYKLILLVFIVFLGYKNAVSQNVSINVLTQNSGLAAINGTVFVEVTIANTSSTTAVPNYKLRPQISVPTSIVSIPATGHILPAGWTIISNAAGVIRVSNGIDQIPANTARTILIAIHGDVLGAPQTVSGNLLFSNGVAPGSASGPATVGDLTADNSSSSTIQVYDPIPLILTDFSAALVNCQPVLNWITETEMNSDRFEIKRLTLNNSNWIPIGVVSANGNSSTKSEYNFIDKNLNVSSEQVFYRLKMIDKDGYYKYSEVLPVFAHCKTTQVHVYPNPVHSGRLYVSLIGASGYTEATLLSLSGQVILKTKMDNGINYFNISNVADGVYVLIIKDLNSVDKKIKVFIQN